MPLAGTLSMYLGEPPERHEIAPGGLIHLEPGTRTPPEREQAELLDSAL